MKSSSWARWLRGRSARSRYGAILVYLAAITGACLGFLPGVVQAPALVLFFLALIVLLPFDLILLIGTGVGAKLLWFALLPALHALGRWCLEGPLEPLFRGLVNAPLVAYCGFEYHAVTGGLVAGVVVGSAVGFVCVRRERKRQKEEPEAAARRALPVRLSGAIVVGVLILMLVVLPGLVGEPLLMRSLEGGLGIANGATVDVAGVDLSLAQGRLAIEGLAMADPSALDRDLLRTTRLEAQVDTGDLLRRRLVMKRVVISSAESGLHRETPGKHIGDRGWKPAPEPPAGEAPGQPLDVYLRRADDIREKLAMARRWLDQLAGVTSRGDGTDLAEEVGLAWTTARDLVKEVPSFWVRELVVEKLRSFQYEGLPLRVVARNLSTHPSLVPDPPALALESEDGRIRFGLILGGIAEGGGENTIELALQEISGDWVGQQLAKDGPPPVTGGTVTLEARGSWDTNTGEIDLPVRAVLRQVGLRLSGMDRPETVEELEIPFALSGTLTRPRVLFRQEDLAEALSRAGKAELANRARREIDEEKDRLRKKLEKEIGGEGAETLEDAARGALEGLFKKREPEKKKDEKP